MKMSSDFGSKIDPKSLSMKKSKRELKERSLGSLIMRLTLVL